MGNRIARKNWRGGYDEGVLLSRREVGRANDRNDNAYLRGGAIQLRVSASVQYQSSSYDIHGQLTESFSRDKATGSVVGELKVLHLLAEGRDEAEVTKLLGEIFGEFCEVEIERGGLPHLLHMLVKRNFVVSKQRGQGPPSTQYLEINVRQEEPSGDAPDNLWAESERELVHS
jgi:hypothetical protein